MTRSHRFDAVMATLVQSPTDPAFVQNPYLFYADALEKGPLHFWQDYGMCAAFSHDAVHALLRDKRLGRAMPPENQVDPPYHLAPFYAVEAHSMLELEPPRHTRLRGLVLRAFTSRRIRAMEGEIAALAHDLIDAMPRGEADLLPAFCTPLPVIVIARLLGVPDSMAPDLLRWSNRMVAMYQANRTRAIEDDAASAARDFAAFMCGYVSERRTRPADDLITHLIAAEEDGEKLSTDELITTCILLLNAGHEATVHSFGNGIKAVLENAVPRAFLARDQIADTVEEILRYDPPLHMFTRYVYEDVTLFDQPFARGDQIALVLGATGRDPHRWAQPDRFLPDRAQHSHLAFGGGVHFCVGAPLARFELATALPILFERLPRLQMTVPPVYGDTYHFHGLTRLIADK